MNEILKTLSNIGIIPVIAIDDAEKAVGLARALCRGGLPAAEVTFRTAAGQRAIKLISEQVPQIAVGAGTVLNRQQAAKALEAGAKYIVSPGYNEDLVQFCLEKGVPVLQGCVNASDITRAVNAGLEVVKFFPAEQSGGIGAIKALAPVFPNVKFMPTGGINTANVMDYLSYDRIIACGGTWMVKKNLIESENWQEIEGICKSAVKTMLGFRLSHIGLTGGQDDIQAAAAAADMFGFDFTSDADSASVGCGIRIIKNAERSFIAIGTNSLDRAVYHLKLRGVDFEHDSCCEDGVFVRGEFFGFGIKIVKN